MDRPASPPPSPRLADLMLNDRGFAFDPNTGESYQLSPAGLACLRGLQQGATTDELITRVTAAWEVDRVTARCDIDAFLWDLQQLDWL
jgi:hypothetical protein